MADDGRGSKGIIGNDAFEDKYCPRFFAEDSGANF